MARAEHHTLAVAAPRELVFETLLDYESMPDWQSTVKRCVVEQRDGEGRGSVVRWEIDAKLRTVGYRLRYAYDPPRRIDTTFVDGDVKDIEGWYRLEPGAGGGTDVTFSLLIDPGMFVPGKVRRMLSDQVLKRSLEDLKAEAERRAGANRMANRPGSG